MYNVYAEDIRFTIEEYLALEDLSDSKSEYYNGEILRLPSVSHNHSLISLNLNQKILKAIDKMGYSLFDNNIKLYIQEYDSLVYPDMMIVCGDIYFFKSRIDIIKNPIIVIEVMSSETQTFDRGMKFEQYRSLKSIQEYVLISQDKLMVETYYKINGKTWLYESATSFKETVLLRTIHYELELADIYKF